MFTFQPTQTDAASLLQYAKLFQASFPGATQLNAQYLNWLYKENPAGGVVGYDAFCGDDLAAHYVCIPAPVMLNGQPRRALLSLNTATHPSYQGKGLFTKLAALTYEYGATQGFNLVYGVANANSTPGFVRKLGFQLVRQLEAKLSIGPVARIDWHNVGQRAGFRRIWSSELLAWRATNPTNRLYLRRLPHQNVVGAYGNTGKLGIVIYGETAMADSVDGGFGEQSQPWRVRLSLGLQPEGSSRLGISMDVPQFLRPSPLNLIYRSLDAELAQLSANAIQLSFLDFDAY